MIRKQNYYEFFGLNTYEDDQILIKKAYRSMALRWHPDRHQTDKNHAEHMMKQVNEVYRILSKHKDEYDSHIGRSSSGKRTDNNSFKDADFADFYNKKWEDILRKHNARSNSYSWTFTEEPINPGDAVYGKSYRTREEAAAAKRKQAEEQKERDKYTKGKSDPEDHPRGNRRVGETSLYSQNQATDILKTWTWDEFTDAKEFIKKRRETKRGST